MPPRVRPPGKGDEESVLEVIVARDVADLGVPDFTLDDLRADWATPGLELEHDVRVAAGAGGAIRGYAILLGDDAVVVVHPEAEGEGTGTVLRRWAEARASERGTAVLRQFAYGANDGARRLLRDAGYEPVQHYFRLRADLAEVPGPAEVPLREFEPGDEADLHRLIEDAFSEIEGHTPLTLEEWRAKGIAKAGHDPRLWLVAEDEQGLVGAALGERWEGATGYVAELAVAARARGRGLGRALLLGAFAAFRRAGLTHAELSVHGRNRGALALYESVGMRTTWEAERWEKALGRP
jgi:mycothiol synthase